MTKARKYILAGVLLLAFLLRVYGLTLYPVGFTADEASFGYDAYSMLKTGNDQWGHKLPLVLESFGDFKAPLYSYIDIPFVAIMGLNRLAVRLPGALIGVASVVVVYFLAKYLIRDTRYSILASLLLAISPWHIQLSRGAFESNLASFFLPLGIFLFLKGLKKKNYLALAALFLGLNMFTYHSAKVVTPLVVFFLVVLYRKELKKFSPHHFFASLIFVVFLLLTAFTFFQGAGRRAADVSIFRGALEAQAQARLEAIESGTNENVAKLLHNQYLTVLDRFIFNYKTYFSVDFLFSQGVREATYGMMPQIGVLYWFELPLLISFLVYLIFHRKEKYLQIILFWLLVAPIPASLTSGVGHAGNRAAVMLPALQIAGAFGAYYMSNFLQQKIKQKYYLIAIASFVIIVGISTVSFVKTYILESPIKVAQGMLYGNLEAAHWLSQNGVRYEKIVVSRSLSEPQIFIGFANKWNPTEYQKETLDWNRYKAENYKFLDQLDSYSLGRYEFKSIMPKDFVSPNTLVVARPEEFSDDVVPLKVFHYPDGDPSIFIVSAQEYN